MAWTDPWFDSIVEFSTMALLLLSIGVLAVRRCSQPIERIRMIQLTLATVFITVCASHSRQFPVLELAWLPVTNLASETAHSIDEGGEKSETTSTGVGTTTLAESPHGIEPSSAPAMGSGPTYPANGAGGDLPSALSKANSISGSWRSWSFWKAIAVWGFLGVSLVQAGLLIGGLMLTRRLVRRAVSFAEFDDPELRELGNELAESGIRVAVSDRIQIPIVTGMVRPTIVLPGNLVRGQLDRERVRHCLDHERKHIEQLDLLTWQLTSVCQVLLWPQPGFWRLRRELRISQDQIADEYATRRQTDPTAYATTLVEFSKARNVGFQGALTMAGTKSNLYRRVEMLLNPEFELRGMSRKRIVGGFACSMLIGSLVLASLRLTPAEASPTPEADAENTSEQRETAANSDPALPKEPAVHTGRVVDAESGEPIANATVIVTRMRSDTWEEIAVTETTTDAQGEYSFEVPVDQLANRYLYVLFDLRHATYAPRHCGSYSYRMIQRNLSHGAAPWFSKLTMVAGAPIEGRLVDGNGQPVAGAAIRLNSQAPGIEGLASQSWAETTSDDQGHFKAIVTAEGTARISIIPEKLCMKHIDAGKKRGDLGDIQLVEGVTIQGVVQDAVGNPVEGLWVNLTEIATESTASYEAKRSSLTNTDGGFQARPIQPGRYRVSVETKATGALEKLKYANFHDEPPPAMFVTQTIDVPAAPNRRPFVIRAVPHVYIQGQCYNPAGEITTCHFPTVIGRMNEQTMWLRASKGDQVGAFRVMVPHGMKSAQLQFMTNEHTGLMIQFADSEPSPQQIYQYETIEEDISDIKIVRYVAPIVQVAVVDESGARVPDARVRAQYVRFEEQEQGQRMMMDRPILGFFEKQDDGLFRSSSLVPNLEVEVTAMKRGFTAEPQRVTLEEGGHAMLTIALKRKDDDGDERNEAGEFGGDAVGSIDLSEAPQGG